MKRKLLIGILALGVTSAMAMSSLSTPAPEPKTELHYGYKTFDLKTQVATTDQALFHASAFAETPIKWKSLKARTSTNDTITNAVTKTQYGDVGFDVKKLTVQVDLNKISGTAAGKLILEGSVDGLQYVRIAASDSLIIANVASQFKIFRPTGLDLNFRYFRAKVIPTGTQSVRMNSFSLSER